MANSIDKSKYVHYIPEAKLDEGFPGNYKFILLDSLSDLEEVLSREFHYVGFDTETSSLDPTQGFIVGYSFCYDGVTAYYVPVRHFDGGLGKPALDLLYAKLCECKQVFLFNAIFDMRVMEYSGVTEMKDPHSAYLSMEHIGYDMSKVRYYDVSIPVWLSDTNKKMPSLKWAERHFLGWNPDTFEETLGDNANFYFVTPAQATFYAATDALGTFKLAQKTLVYWRESGVSAKIDNTVLYALMKMEETPLSIDYDWLYKCREEAKEEILSLEKEIYSIVGYTFEINSNKQKGEALLSLGITTGKMTKGGSMAVGQKVLDSAIDRYEKAGQEPPKILSLFQRYSKAVKLESSYIQSLLNEADRTGNKLRFHYMTNNVPTGRLSAGSDKKNPFFAKLNAQALPKPHSKMWYYRKAVPESNPEYTVLGYEFSLEPFGLGDQERWCEGKDPHLNIRKAFKAPEDSYIFFIDFSGEELRIAGNLSGDRGFTEAFLHGKDVHQSTAEEMFGAENYNKDKRKIAKGFNFGLLYGMSTYSVADRYKVDLATAEKWVSLYENAHKGVFLWMESKRKLAKKVGTVYNYFGRPRRVKYWLQSPDGKQRAFGYRTVVNTLVQSVGAEFIKIVLARDYDTLLNNPKWWVLNEDGTIKRRKVTFVESVHRPLGFKTL